MVDTMTLAQWKSRTGILPTHPTTERGAVSMIVADVGLTTTQLMELWRLEDYAVSSVSGPIVWLVPRQ